MKTCSKCKVAKEDSEFSIKRKTETKTLLNSYCKPCHSVYRKEHYEKNRQKYLNKAGVWRKKYKEIVTRFFFEYFALHPCVDCGESDPVVLEFDHRDSKQKLMPVAELFNRGFPLLEIKKEVKKCDVRCANCHRRKTAIEHNWWSAEIMLVPPQRG